MIYMEPIQLGWKPLVTSWMEHQLPDFVTKPQQEMIGVSKKTRKSEKLKVKSWWLDTGDLAVSFKSCVAAKYL